MRNKLIFLLLILLISCGTYKTQYYIHKADDPIIIIDSINKVHGINIPTSHDYMSKTTLYNNNKIYTMYHHVCYKGDTLYVASITIPSDTSKYIVKLRKELNR